MAAATAAAVVSQALGYTFDTDNQGWQQANFDETTFALTILGPSTWSPSGYIEEGDFADWAFDVSPFLAGGYQGTTQVSFDYSADATDQVAYPLLVLASPAAAVYRVEAPTADGAFHHYAYSLGDPTGWQYADSTTFRAATQADIDNVLTGLVLIGVDADTFSGADHTRLDNVNLGAVPEPASCAGLLALPVLAKLRKRKA